MNKYPALQKNLNLKSRRYFIETDYVNGIAGISSEFDIRALNDSEKAFLNQFYEEVIISTFRKDGTDLYPTDEQRRELYRENNHRNTCLYNFKQKTGQLDYLNSSSYDYTGTSHLDHELLYINEMEAKEIAQHIVQLKEEFNLEFQSIHEFIKKTYPEFFYRNFTTKELKDMGKTELGRTLYVEAKMILQ